ncbi:MAG: hypothetical protein HC880_13100 [Bacteroidia bacterium]|nr:hypothetical protein [Bacteroidia bacterium]
MKHLNVFYLACGLLFGAIWVVYCLGAQLDVMDIDAAQYASISRDMSQSGEIIQVQERGKDYLDKPPPALLV